MKSFDFSQMMSHSLFEELLSVSDVHFVGLVAGYFVYYQSVLAVIVVFASSCVSVVAVAFPVSTVD